MSIADKITTIADKLPEVYESGKDAGERKAYDTFWDNYQENGKRTIYRYAFCGAGWNKDTFNPKYNITIPAGSTTGVFVFGYFNTASIGGQEPEPLDFTQFNDRFDFSKITIGSNLFDNANIINLVANLENATNLSRVFAGGNGGGVENLVVKITDKCTTLSGAFASNSKLTNISFLEGSSIAITFGVDTCPNLTATSLNNIIAVLKDYSGTTTTKTLTLGSNHLAKLTEAEKQIATDKGWSLV